MKRILAVLLSCAMLLTGCTVKSNNDNSSEHVVVSTVIEDTTSSEQTTNAEENTSSQNSQIDTVSSLPLDTTSEEYINSLGFSSLNDPDFMRYIEDTVYSDLVNQLKSDDYFVENVEAIYISKEYLDELAYNSQENIYFGYKLSELDEAFQGQKYIFTLGENGQTDVQPFEEYDDTFDKVIRNVAIGTGVILLCVTVSVVTGGLGAPAVSMVFAASAKSATIFALSSGAISGVSAGVVEGIQTHDFDKAVKAAALKGSEGFKWGAITGAVVGGAEEYLKIKETVKVVEALDDYPVFVDDANLAVYDIPGIEELPEWRAAELRAYQVFGGEEQVSFLNGEKLLSSTKGATRPDLVRTIGNSKEAVEVKFYDLEHNLSGLCTELKRQVSERIVNLPKDYSQRIVLDVTGRGYSREIIENAVTKIGDTLFDIYPNIPINVIGA